MTQQPHQEDRKYVEERHISIPVTQPYAKYRIRNKTFGPIQITLQEPGFNRLQTMILKRKEEIVVEGTRMTDYVWLLAAQRKPSVIDVSMLPESEE
jgi:hypothetical protein